MGDGLESPDPSACGGVECQLCGGPEVGTRPAVAYVWVSVVGVYERNSIAGTRTENPRSRPAVAGGARRGPARVGVALWSLVHVSPIVIERCVQLCCSDLLEVDDRLSFGIGYVAVICRVWSRVDDLRLV